MPPDATATKTRILDAAFAEFAEYGLAGARMDRIAEKADANKRSIYVHFGHKEELFDLVVARTLAAVSEAVPFNPADLPGYAGALFDYILTSPDLVRLATWAQFERPEATTAEINAYRKKVEALAQHDGRATTHTNPVDVLALVHALIFAWFTTSPALRGLAPEEQWSPERLAAHRAAVIAAVQALVDR
ncbi:putative TetR family regulatory protein [Acrocarpospora corrugata]|uniref:Putative TetR family regulatory protein n=1 Tax=Acrocarpospora corrugata TaxID=35763 RepID=A0A5M3W8P4_9ACTN|nr:TetR family transcriptional regulator [Acrocarpospora corrugata]GES05234.1 putative TetR family regulatory protein [Acrocarpospora corrugata]